MSKRKAATDLKNASKHAKPDPELCDICLAAELINFDEDDSDRWCGSCAARWCAACDKTKPTKYRLSIASICLVCTLCATRRTAREEEKKEQPLACCVCTRTGPDLGPNHCDTCNQTWCDTCVGCTCDDIEEFSD